MLGSVTASVVFTVLYAGTGGYALLRWASLVTGASPRPGDPVAELAHLVMSLAMIGMVWGYAGDTADLVQIVLFGGLGCYFALRLLSRHPGCSSPGGQVLMCAAMVWMVAAMPLLMGHGSESSPGMADMPGMDMGGGSAAPAPTGPAPGWAVAVNLLVALALVVAAGGWARRALRSPAPRSGPVAPVQPAPGGVLTETRAPRLPARLTPRADAVCHLLMSLSMAVTLLVMA
jgi:hypothetical protein